MPIRIVGVAPAYEGILGATETGDIGAFSGTFTVSGLFTGILDAQSSNDTSTFTGNVVILNRLYATPGTAPDIIDYRLRVRPVTGVEWTTGVIETSSGAFAVFYPDDDYPALSVGDQIQVHYPDGTFQKTTVAADLGAGAGAYSYQIADAAAATIPIGTTTTVRSLYVWDSTKTPPSSDYQSGFTSIGLGTVSGSEIYWDLDDYPAFSGLIGVYSLGLTSFDGTNESDFQSLGFQVFNY